MNEYEKLKKEFDEKVKKLQDNCPHTELTEPLEIFWAPGHSCGYKARFCKRCNKQMDDRIGGMQFSIFCFGCADFEEGCRGLYTFTPDEPPNCLRSRIG